MTNHSVEAIRTVEFKDNTASGAAGQLVKVPGLIEAVKLIITKKKEEMAFVTVSDELGTSSVTVFSAVYNKTKQLLKEGNLILVDGKVELKYNKKSIIANKITMSQ
ncbi:OB-fold nucleic acid binding domain-containing protein [Lysinibacillus xylanilyticus]|uniref:OB domain-containing protein n=1 Tax=Lysinibacillus xylanilyticus TaxID=582475 RepID=A0A2M9Q9X7_9BACI|nr:OB-fold nucleic acid binding domain-containing protein [Lysinibacillus xylanilyticus]PJO44870.1 hypothetical protein CWD94_04065 [Lysinibacillus xylanilyticus]